MKRKMTVLGGAVLLLVFAVLAGCNRNQATGLEVTPNQVTITSLAPEDQVRLQAKAMSAKGDEIANKEFKYSSSDPTVVDVDQTGLLLPKRSGEAIVTVQTDKIGQSVPVSVTIYSQLKLVEEVVEVDVGQSRIIEVQILDEAGNPILGEVVWTVANPGVASVDAAGALSGVSEGETTATATAGKLSSSVNVKVKPGAAAPAGGTAPAEPAPQAAGGEQDQSAQ